MSIQELKELLHKQIGGFDDEQLLEAVNVILSKNQRFFEIPASHLSRLKNTLKSEKDEFYTLNEFEEKYNLSSERRY